MLILGHAGFMSCQSCCQGLAEAFDVPWLSHLELVVIEWCQSGLLCLTTILCLGSDEFGAIKLIDLNIGLGMP